MSHKSFRKWLLQLENPNELFKDDSTTLLALADKYSKRGKIYEILRKHIDKEEFNRYSIWETVKGKFNSKEDPIELIKALSPILLRIEDRKISNEIRKLNNACINMPTEKEKPMWDKTIFNEKRNGLKILTPKIIKVYEEVMKYCQAKNGTLILKK